MPYKYKNPYRHKFPPLKYRVTNWHEYNQALRDRGNITIWFDEKNLNQWYANCMHKQGAQRIYSNKAIEIIGIITGKVEIRVKMTDSGYVKTTFTAILPGISQFRFRSNTSV